MPVRGERQRGSGSSFAWWGAIEHRHHRRQVISRQRSE
jgi:hypothetical protein